MQSTRASNAAGGPAMAPCARAVQEQLRRVLASDGFKHSRRMADLLHFIVSQTVAGNEHRLKEYVIALEVFGRDESFDPRLNALVRVEASRLRHRLREYFQGPGRDDAIEIELPAGRYVPRFTTARARTKARGVASSAALLHREASPAPGDRPSIALLPFTFDGDHRSDRSLAHGIAEALIAGLSRVHWLLVAAHSSTRRKSRPLDARKIGREAGVRYVLAGGVRSAGERIRVFVELADAITGNVLWAHRYDRELDDPFELEDAIARTIAAAVEIELAAAERERAARRSPESLEAWALYQRGLGRMYCFTAQDSYHAKQLFRQAAEADPRFGSPVGALAYAGFLDFVLGFTASPEETVAEALAAGRTAVARDGRDPMAHFGLGRALSLAGRLGSAIDELGAAIELNPNFAPAYLGMGGAMSLSGRHRKAIDALDVAIGLSPHAPMLWTMEHMRALSHIELGEFDEAVEDARLACRHPNTTPWSYLTLVAGLSNLHRDDEAHAVRTALFERWPAFSVPRFARTVPFDVAVTPRWRDGLRRAGLGNG